MGSLQMKDSNREAFEEWYENAIGRSLVYKTHNKSYLNSKTQKAWETWQAAKVESHKQAALYQFEINHLAQANEQWREKATKAQAIPEGFVLVPKEPTSKMIDSTWDYQDEIDNMSHNSRNALIYKNMIRVAIEEAAQE